MNLTGRPPYQKGQTKKKHNRPSTDDRRHWERVRELGCTLRLMGISHKCMGPITIHHCGTGGGGRKDHTKVVPLCFEAHLGRSGIDGRVISKKVWQDTYTTEAEMLEIVKRMMGEPCL